MQTPNFSGRKRPRSEDPLTPPYFRTDNGEPEYCCTECEKCQYMFREVAELKQQLNDKINELNRLIESINYRFNDKGTMLSYIS